MKRFMVILMILFSTSIFAAEPGTPIKGLKSNGSFGWVSITDTGSVNVSGGSSGVPSTASQTVILITSSDYNVVAFSGRSYVSLSATGTFEFEYGNTSVTANTTPCYSDSREVSDAVSLHITTTATNTYVTIRQE